MLQEGPQRTCDGSNKHGTNLTFQAPEVQTMYSLNLPVSAVRTKIRQEFERHRYVNQLKTVDVLLFNSHQEYQVRSEHSYKTQSQADGKADKQIR